MIRTKTSRKNSDNINRSTGTPITRFPDTDFKINMLTTFQEIKDIKIRKEVKVLLFADDMILCIENPKESTNKFLKLINNFNKIVGY